jgi:hypothetical protein
MRKIGVLLPLLGIACGSDQGFGDNVPEYPPSFYVPLVPVQQVDRILQVTTPQVDVLWTIDNSCSMANEQDELAENFPLFIDYFLGSGLDYHIGVTSTDLDYKNRVGADGKLVVVNGMNFIDTRTPSPEIVFAGMARLGTSGSGNEKGLGATFKALEEKRDTTNAGFYRDDASIHTVVISDERDQTPANLITESEFKDWYDGLKQDNDDRTFSCIVNMSGYERGTAYLNTAADIGGITWDITDEDWSEVLERLGIQASGLEYFLSQRPVPGTVSVSVINPLGAEIRFTETQLDPVTGEPLSEAENTSLYTYDSTRNSITFLTFIPEALSTVLLEYTLLSAEQVQEGL